MENDLFFNCEKSYLNIIYYYKDYDLKTNLQKFYSKNKSNNVCEKSYKCKNCNFSTFSLLFFLKHNLICQENFEEKIQTNSQCPYCRYKAKQSVLKDHIIRKHTPLEKIKWYKCDHCAYKGKVKKDLIHHIKIHKSDTDSLFYCTHCNYNTNTKGHLKRHIFAKHTAPENVPKYECSSCKYKTLNKADLKRHILRRHTAPGKIQWHQCEQCCYRSKDKNGLERHRKTCHIKEEIKLLYCDHCEYKSKTSFNLKMHVLRKHTVGENVLKYQCNTCKFKTLRKDTLKKHMLRHTVSSKKQI